MAALKILDPKYLKDLGERVLWTGVEAGLGLVTVEALDIPTAYAAVVAAALAVVKGWVAKKVGKADSAGFTKE